MVDIAIQEEVVEEPIQIEKTKGHVLDVGPPTLSGELACGYIDPNGKIHTTFIVKEMSGEEEDLLAGRGPAVPRLNQVITNCLVSVGSLTEKKDIALATASLTAVDRVIVLITLRRVSLGDFYDIKMQCPDKDCSLIQNFSLDLSELEIKTMKDPKKRRYETELESGVVVRWHIMDTDDESWLADKRKKKMNLLTMTLLSRIDEIDNVPLAREYDEGAAVEMLKRMRYRDRAEIRKIMNDIEGDVDTKCEFVCEACGREWESMMDVSQPGFFFPSGV